MEGEKSSRRSTGPVFIRLLLRVASEFYKRSACIIALASLIKSMPQTTYVYAMPSVSLTRNCSILFSRSLSVPAHALVATRA